MGRKTGIECNRYVDHHIDPSRNGCGLTSVSPVERTAKTDINGNYAFYDVASGNYWLTVTKDGYSTTTSNVSLTSDGIASGGTTVSAVIYAQNPSHDINQAIR